jgi:enolase
MMNIINGGAHSDAPIDFQEFMIMPIGVEDLLRRPSHGVARSSTPSRSVLKEKGLATAVGDEGGFAPKLEATEAALDAIALAVKNAGYKLGKSIHLALDVASSEFYVKDEEARTSSRSRPADVLSGDDMVEFYAKLAAKYPIISIEDGCAEGDWATWKKLTDAIGDQRAAGRRRSVRHQHRSSCARASKPAPPTRSSSRSTRSARSPRRSMPSNWRKEAKLHGRHLATAPARRKTSPSPTSPSRRTAGQIKTGSLCRTDRVAKYNQLLRIEEELGASAIYGGKMKGL